MSKLKIRRGDKIVVTTGKDKGKTGSIIKVFPNELKVIVSGINIVKKHTKPSRTSEGGIIAKELPIHISNVAHVDPKSGKATKVGIKVKNGKKIRYAKKSGEEIKTEGE